MPETTKNPDNGSEDNGPQTMRQEMNEVKPAIAPTHCLEKVCSQQSKEEETSGLLESRRQSRESREPKAAGIPGEEYQRGENHRDRELWRRAVAPPEYSAAF